MTHVRRFDHVGLTVSDLEALPASRLYELWVEQRLFGDRVSVRVGQLAADQEFLVSDYAALFLNKARTIDAGIAGALTFAVFWFVGRTRLGKSLRAAAINPEAALYMGIDVSRAHHVAFGLGTAIAAISGGLVAVYYPAQPFVGIEFLIIIYAGVVLGGLGNIRGAFWGGMLIGLIQQLSTLAMPMQLQNAAIFVVFVLILLFRPEGLFGRSAERA